MRTSQHLAIAPGIVDTAMQEEIRSADESSFPLATKFQRLLQKWRTVKT